ncbi:short chain dehydrogenase [Neoconidiobolus thromboides FSU 785]|nr:short chain dehydrogenase [Neoconidiobolus thromboides FSU 785]
MSLKGKNLLITGASRGIGLAIAIRAAKDGANVAILAKTAEPHPKLPGTIYTAAEEIRKAGGKALPIVCDIRFEDQIINAINKTVAEFGGIDIVVNNASAIYLKGTEEVDAKRYDLLNQVNARGTYLVSKYAIPHLKKSRNPHILNMSPPLTMEEKWFSSFLPYTMAKYGMSMCVLGMSEEFKGDGIKVNALWPYTSVLTAALDMIEGFDAPEKSRKPEIMADSAHLILTKEDNSFTGNFIIDEILLREAGIDMDQYAVVPGSKNFNLDMFLNKDINKKIEQLRAKL